MTRPSGVFDPGLQLERTALAWNRTALALLVGAVASARLTLHGWGPASLLLAGLGTVAAGGVALWARRRYRQSHHRLLTTGRLGGAGPAIAVMTLLGFTVAVLAAVFVVDAAAS